MLFIKTVYIKNLNRNIGDGAFENCASLTSVIIGDSANLANIGDSAFENCFSLQNLIGDFYISSIGNYAFKNCCAFNGFYRLTDDGSYPPIINLQSIGIDAFYGINYPNKVFTIPVNMQTIGSRAFRGCRGLEALIIPSYVNAIENETFCFDCENLTDIAIIGTPTIGYEGIISGTFSSCIRIFIPVANLSFFQNDPVWGMLGQFFTIEYIEDNLNYLRNKKIDMTKYGYSWP